MAFTFVNIEHCRIKYTYIKDRYTVLIYSEKDISFSIKEKGEDKIPMQQTNQHLIDFNKMNKRILVDNCLID